MPSQGHSSTSWHSPRSHKNLIVQASGSPWSLWLPGFVTMPGYPPIVVSRLAGPTVNVYISLPPEVQFYLLSTGAGQVPPGMRPWGMELLSLRHIKHDTALGTLSTRAEDHLCEPQVPTTHTGAET